MFADAARLVTHLEVRRKRILAIMDSVRLVVDSEWSLAPAGSRSGTIFGQP